jgi:hypothetical protein
MVYPASETSSTDVLPPADPIAMLRLAGFGLGLCLLATLVGLITDVRLANTLRLLLVAVGALSSAIALTKRPGDWQLWALTSLTFLFAWPGMPEHWDSARMVAQVLGVLAGIGGLLVYAPNLRTVCISAFILFHFGNMVTATTLPDPRPWVSQQLMTRVYTPYMRFMYLSNAYHFYSPDPGPSSHLFCLITWETNEQAVTAEGAPKFNADGTPDMTKSGWVELPRRDTQFKDPLGLTYYRRLSLTELVSGSVPSNLTIASFEKNESYRRRAEVAAQPTNYIPFSPLEPRETQLRIPNSEISERLFPSYARHIASSYSSPGRRVLRMKLYRVVHHVVQVHEFLQKDEDGRPVYSPFTPLSFRPYYLGEYSPEGVLLNPKDPMLYWLLPILSNGRGGIEDYMSKHAGFEYVWRERP